MVYKFFDKKSKGSSVTNASNYQFANELQNQLLENFKKEKCILHLKTISGVLI